MDHTEIFRCMRLGPEWPLPFASFEIECVSGVCELSKLSAGQNKLYEEMQEKMSLRFVLDCMSVHDSGVEKVCDLAREYFWAVVLTNKSVMLRFQEKSCQVLAL